MSMSMYNDVLQFHTVFELAIGKIPSLPEESQRTLRRNLLTEEYQEYIDAEADNDLIEIADALADMIYIINGTLVVYGLPGHNSKYALFDDMGIPALPEGERAASRKTRMADIVNCYEIYMLAENNNDLQGISSALKDLTDAIFTCSYVYNIPLVKVFNEVHRSNLAKLVDGKVLRRTDGKVQKPSGWLPPDIKGILFPA